MELSDKNKSSEVNPAIRSLGPSNYPSHDRDPVEAIRFPLQIATFIKGSNRFPVKVHRLLNQVEQLGYDHIVSWQPHGRAFLIHKPKEFEEQIMPHYFSQSRKLSSFQRQLNLYDFIRFSRGRDKGAYYHPLFLKNKPSLVKEIARNKVKGTGVRFPSQPELEPDFYAMPPLSKTDDHANNLTPKLLTDKQTTAKKYVQLKEKDQEAKQQLIRQLAHQQVMKQHVRKLRQMAHKIEQNIQKQRFPPNQQDHCHETHKQVQQLKSNQMILPEHQKQHSKLNTHHEPLRQHEHIQQSNKTNPIPKQLQPNNEPIKHVPHIQHSKKFKQRHEKPVVSSESSSYNDDDTISVDSCTSFQNQYNDNKDKKPSSLSDKQDMNDFLDDLLHHLKFPFDITNVMIMPKTDLELGYMVDVLLRHS